MKRFVVVGLSNFGIGVAETLAAQGHEVVVVDPEPVKIDTIAPRVERAVVGDATRIAVLERAGCEGANAAIVGVGDDITASILSTLALKDLRIPEIYVKVVSFDHARVMEKLGVAETIFPERESAVALGHRLAATGVLNYVALGPGISIQEMATPTAWEGRSLKELNLRQRHGIQVVAVRDVLRDILMVVPDPDRPLTASDTLIVSGGAKELARLGTVG